MAIDRERVVREVREAADMEHPWIPGARADLIRDAATLLEAPLAALLEDVDDLEAVVLAVAREQAIREGMAETGEDRQTLTDFLDAHISMGREAVLDLMDGEPTTLAAGLRRYLDEIQARDELQPRDRIVDDLETLLAYPWPGESGHV
jgi:hypothetical protein